MNRFLKNRGWLLCTIAASFSWAVWGVLTKFIAHDITPYSYQLLFTLGMLLSLPFVIRRCKTAEFNTKGFALGIAISLFAIIGNISVYRSFTLGGQASVVLPLTNLSPVVTILIALFLFKEKLYYLNGLGILVVIPAIFILSGQTQIFTATGQFFSTLGLNAWLFYALLSLVLFGMFSASQKITAGYLSAEWSFISFITASVLVSLGFILFGLVDFKSPTQTLVVGSMAGLFDGLGVLAVYAAYRVKGQAAQVSSIVTSIQQVLTILLAILFLKETITTIEFVGIAMAVAGAWLISLEKKEITKPLA